MAELTRKQWEDAARFAEIKQDTELAVLPNGLPAYWVTSTDNHHFWQPLTDWNDFGPLWVKLDRWVPRNDVSGHPVLRRLLDLWRIAKKLGTERELMQAGVLLAAAIGSTMREEGK